MHLSLDDAIFCGAFATDFRTKNTRTGFENLRLGSENVDETIENDAKVDSNGALVHAPKRRFWRSFIHAHCFVEECVWIALFHLAHSLCFVSHPCDVVTKNASD